MRINKPENSFTRERFVHRYVHPSGLIRWRFLYQRQGHRSQKYFETLEEAIEHRNKFMTKLGYPGYQDENIFNITFT